MFVKICGLTSDAAVEAAIEAGADALGFVFAASSRQVTPARARQLARVVPPDIVRVAVMLHPDAASWIQVRDEFGPDWLQTEQTDFAALDIPAHIGRLPVYRDTAFIDYDSAARSWPDHLLFEGARSGAGQTADWGHAAALARHTCLVLAGGLNPDNVADAILQVRPWGVDVSSGVESSPGVKDPVKIAAFVHAARQAGMSYAG